jgi:hypothetical protein
LPLKTSKNKTLKQTKKESVVIVMQEFVSVHFKIKVHCMVRGLVKPRSNVEDLISMVKHDTN